MNEIKTVLVLALGLFMARSALAADDSAGRVKIGVYDSRSVAVAFVGSATWERQIADLKAQIADAEKSDDKERVKALKAQPHVTQKRLHMQAFGTAPVDNILETIKGGLEVIRTEKGLLAIVSKWDEKALEQYESAEQIDVTMDIVKALKPNEQQLKSAIAIQKSKPVPMKELQKMIENGEI